MDNGLKPFPQLNEIEANNYSGTEGQVLSSKGEETIAKGLVEAKDNMSFDGQSSILLTGSIQSKGYRVGVQGWRLNSDGTVEFNSLASTYTPTRSAEANLDSSVTMAQAQYSKVGSVVTVSGRFTADPTLTATTTSFEMTLPIASDIGAVEDVAGVAFCGNIAAMGAEITGVVANNTAKVVWKSSDVTSQSWAYIFSYQII